MSSTVATITFLTLTVVTAFLTVMMYFDRAKFIRTLKGQKGFFFNFRSYGPDEFLTMMQITFPIKLETATDERLKKMRDVAVRSTRYVLISLLITLTFPVILSKILEWAGI